jgi:predicted ATPase/DNA-binding SARP family transcriptional activator
MESGTGGEIEVRLLGGFEVLAAGRELAVGTGQQRALLAILVLRLNRVVSRDELVEQLWGDGEPRSAATSLHSLVSRLRRQLAEAGGAVALETREPGYLLRADPACVDAHRFEQLVARARDHLARREAEPAASLLREALGLWRGRALLDVADVGLARLEADRLEEARLSAVEDLADAELVAGHLQATVALLEPHVAAQPFRERACGQLMTALYRLGRQADALAAYRRLRATVIEELGVEPTPALRRLEERILHHSPDLDGPEPHSEAVGAPAPRGAATTPRHNLPAALTAFIGRRAELGELAGLLDTGRLLTLLGVGGAGKTRLAIELAGSVLDLFPDGAWLVDLSPLRDPRLVADELTSALGLPSAAFLGGSVTPEDRLCTHLRDRAALIVLDNCEHLVEAAASVAHALLTRCPRVSILATSRERLGLGGELVWSVPPLSLPPAGATFAEDVAGSDAVALFCDRARSAQPGFAVSAANATPVAHICRRLDGIPLALELAAARLRILSAHQVAERLDDRFRLLTGGDRTAMPRHQTLRATMDWSYQLLPAPEQALLRRLAVFPGTFDLAAAEAAGGDAAEAGAGFDSLDLLSRLVDKSLVTVLRGETDDRYRLLETVREYASTRLQEAGEAEDARLRHRDHFVRLAALGPGWWWNEFGGAMQWLDADAENFTAALDLSLQRREAAPSLRLGAFMWPYWLYGGHHEEGVRRLEEALALPDETSNPDRIEAMSGLAFILPQSSTTDFRPRERLLADALELAERTGDRTGQGRVCFLLAQEVFQRGEVDRSRTLIAEALASGALNRNETGWCHYQLGQEAITLGDLDTARVELERALELARNGTVLIPHVLAALAPVAALAGEPDRALRLATEAIDAGVRLGLVAGIMLTLTRATEARILAGDIHGARRTLRRLLEEVRGFGGIHYGGDALEMAALVAERTGRPALAARLLGAACTLRRDCGEPVGGTRAISPAVRDCVERLRDAATDAPPLSPAEALVVALAELDAVEAAATPR